MSPKIFLIEEENDTIIVSPLTSVTSLAEDHVQEELAALLVKLQADKIDRLVIDFSKVKYFGSSMLEALRRLWTEITPHQGKMVLCGLNDVTREIIHITAFDKLWRITVTREEALVEVHKNGE